VFVSPDLNRRAQTNSQEMTYPSYLPLTELGIGGQKMRDVIIIGNGLGRAIDNDKFDLQTAIDHVWACPDTLTGDEKTNIKSLISDPSGTPQGEGDLSKVHLAWVACRHIESLTGDQERTESLLSQHGKKFPKTIEKFVYAVAQYFHGHGENWESEHSYFFAALTAHVTDTHSHIATLNYDKLLYRPLCFDDLFTRYKMRDGFRGNRISFDPDNHDRYTPSRESYYLHLHGSPLFHTDAATGKIRKSSVNDDATYNPDRAYNHIVLTHVDHKPTIIDASPILSTYWKWLDVALQESTRITVFGYGGGDDHLNRKLRATKKPIRVICRTADTETDADWARLGPTVTVTRVGNILEFTDWVGGAGGAHEPASNQTGNAASAAT
jgi:hypothetical protein